MAGMPWRIPNVLTFTPNAERTPLSRLSGTARVLSRVQPNYLEDRIFNEGTACRLISCLRSLLQRRVIKCRFLSATRRTGLTLLDVINRNQGKSLRRSLRRHAKEGRRAPGIRRREFVGSTEVAHLNAQTDFSFDFIVESASASPSPARRVCACKRKPFRRPPACCAQNTRRPPTASPTCRKRGHQAPQVLALPDNSARRCGRAPSGIQRLDRLPELALLKTYGYMQP
jgi:hypothetical protein